MNLKSLSTQELDTRIKSLAQQERELLHQVLLTIKEIDSRKLYFQLGANSLFAYLTEKVGYTNGSAQRRIDAAKLLKELPEIGEKIESGKINLGHIALLQTASRDVFKRLKSRVTTEQKRELISSLLDKNHKESQQEVSSFFNIPILVKTKKSVQSDGSIRVELTLSKELSEQIERAQALLSHAVPSADLVDYLDYVTKRIIQQKTSVRKSKSTTIVVVNPNTQQETKNESANTALIDKNGVQVARNQTLATTSKHSTDAMVAEMVVNKLIKFPAAAIPLKARASEARKFPATTVVVKGFSARQKKIVLNQNSRCMHKDPKTGQVCGSRWFLQIDHRQSLWAGGKSDLQNAQVLCAHHNQAKYLNESRIN